MKIYYPMIAAILAASMSSVVVAEEVAAETPAGDQAAPQALGAPRTPAEMRQRMEEMRQQHMQRMQANRQAMPMMGPRGGMMNPEMMQRMQEMHRQRMEMMQAGRPAMPSPPAAVQEPVATPEETDTAPSVASVAADAGCAQMRARHGMGGMHDKGMKKQMMAMRKQHMQVTEQRLANIENLMRELVDLLKNSR